MKIYKILSTLLVLLSLSGCSLFSDWYSVFETGDKDTRSFENETQNGTEQDEFDSETVTEDNTEEEEVTEQPTEEDEIVTDNTEEEPEDMTGSQDGTAVQKERRFVLSTCSFELITLDENFSEIDKTDVSPLNCAEIVYGNNTFLAIDFLLGTSGDDCIWDVSDWSEGNGGQDGIFINDLFLKAGAYYEASEDTYYARVATSNNGLDWEDRLLDIKGNLNCIVYGNGVYIAGGSDGLILITDDLINWQSREIGSDTIQKMAYGNNIFTAVSCDSSNRKTVIISKDKGETWEPVLLSSDKINDVVFGNGFFIAIGHEGFISKSVDGENWSDFSLEKPYSSGPYNPPSHSSLILLNGGTFADGKFVIAGSENLIITSIDGENWEAVTPFGDNFYTDIGFGEIEVP